MVEEPKERVEPSVIPEISQSLPLFMLILYLHELMLITEISAPLSIKKVKGVSETLVLTSM